MGDTGDPLRFDHPRQISKMAGYNLVEDSSARVKAQQLISKRGRRNLRSVLYRMAMIMIAVNNEMKELYQYLKTAKTIPSRRNKLLFPRK
nr:IS110 family transposase [Dehalobacter restrictus]